MTMFIVSYAGKFYGPFQTADAAASFGKAFAGPWQIVTLHAPDNAGQV
jgi:hypothetical protein